MKYKNDIYRQIVNPYYFNNKNITEVAPLEYDGHNVYDIFNNMQPNTYYVYVDNKTTYFGGYNYTVVRLADIMYMFNDSYIAKVTEDTWQGVDVIDPNTQLTADIWYEMFITIGADKYNISHYKYLELVIDTFWVSVFGKTPSEMFCGGIVGAHGDKGSGYERTWKYSEPSINFNRGMLLFLLTYTKVMDRPKIETGQWVIDNYPKYLDRILLAEKEAGFI